MSSDDDLSIYSEEENKDYDITHDDDEFYTDRKAECTLTLEDDYEV